MKNTITLMLLLGLSHFSIAQNDISNFNLRITPSFEHISVHVDFDGDDNFNSEFELTFAEAEINESRIAAPSVRAHKNQIVDGSQLDRNFHAASVMFLKSFTVYRISIVITDPDGGLLQESRMVTTKRLPGPAVGGNIKIVVPEDWNGSGVTDPIYGLQAAADNAIPGDVFLIKEGIYAPFEITTSGTEFEPIVFFSGNPHDAIIDGGGTDRGIITLGTFDDSLSHVIIYGMKIENGNWGVDAQNTNNVAVQNCKFSNVGYGYINRRENGWEHDQFISNNEFIGTTSWPSTGIPSERCIDIRGNNNTVSYNYIENFGDGVSTDGPPYGTSYGLDIHNNDFNRIVDDFIEVDGIVSNARIYSNRGFNGRMGASLAPVLGGPAYIFRNVFYNMELSTFKMNRGPSGLIMVHNTGLKAENASSSPAGWQNTFLANNVLCGSRYCFEEFGLIDGSTDQWDYNAYFSTREIGVEPWFKWDDVRYDNITDLFVNTGLEENGIEIDLGTFVNGSLPEEYTIEYTPQEVDLNLSANSPCINSGLQINNMNDPFVTDGMPDRGAIEFGADEIIYGPTFEFTSSTEETIGSIDFSVRPNPVSDILSIQTDLDFQYIQLIDINGRALRETQRLQIDVSSLNKGVYFIRAFDEKNKLLAKRKFVKVD